MIVLDINLILTNESSMLAEDGQIDYNPTSTIYFSSRLNVEMEVHTSVS
ncbi:MAG: hypothetical protein Ct9H90mP7_5180 [Candidatus Neomarinimicrobiota bacterium]|nr:MAG: hypothetical protein Ct9H90mP7_5180 [Candidatus Neomarinimicrobiota bacterium]